MAAIQVIYDGPNGIWGSNNTTSLIADVANMMTVMGMTPDLTVIVQIKLDSYSDWADFQQLDSTVSRAIINMTPPSLFSRVIGLSQVCRVLAQR